MQTYMRWQKDESRIGRTFPALVAGHPASELTCPGCNCFLGNDQPVTLMALGPGPAPEEQRRHAEGGWYPAVAILAHSACLGV